MDNGFGFNRLQSDNNISSNTKNFINELSNVMDSRIAEINDQLQQSKREVLESYKEMIDETDKNSIHIKDYFNIMQNECSSNGIEKIEMMRKFRDNLTTYLNDAGKFAEIHDKFANDKLSDIITKKKDKYCFINYKINPKPGVVLWNKTQDKQNFSLENEGQIMSVNFTGCYELYKSENVFKEGKFSISMEVVCEQTSGYHSIGLVNEEFAFNSSCICCKNACFFMVNKLGDCFNNAVTTNYSGIKFEDNPEPYLFEIEINLDDPLDKKWSFKINGGEEFGPFTLRGNEFRIAAGMCNGGKAKYTFI